MTGNLYFAYGSNMDADQMAFRRLEVVEARGAVLDGHRLVFDFPARSRWLGGAADVVRERGARVEGVLYTLANPVSIMDAWEGGYERIAVDVLVPSTGATFAAWTYVVIEKGPPMTPSEVYVGQMLKGAREAGLSGPFIEELEGHMEAGRRELGDHVLAVRALATASRPMALEELATAVERPVDRVEAVLSDLGRWGWVRANNEPPVFRIVEGKEERSPWVLR
jgi:gamma-glutamylcyclotransferase